MKFSSFAIFAVAALVKADPAPSPAPAPAPSPAPGLFDDISTFITGAAGKVSSFVDNVHSNWDEGLSKGHAVNSAIDSIFASDEPSKVIASLTSEAAPLFSSLSSVAATATGAAASSVSADISKLSASLASETSRAAAAASSRSKDAAPAQTGFLAMGALMGGAAVLANM
ncbi:hypothetical protein BBK36DRAFT_1139348 [Trichoderma citrinoviride]|uniref:Uncharacterized protein n=1 Tax=Trichoderma citrinoviride TaxID=58853 RepID=A0A2T4BEQ9_9HYPO|nr:hypothetical protein BBK36DRAFT_1139348 [Trichoderma citrinoviride]PTB67822.1 hypothetical protein BBK36DRAFT_1139348 [Trichoderma citrinoviride]